MTNVNAPQKTTTRPAVIRIRAKANAAAAQNKTQTEENFIVLDGKPYRLIDVETIKCAQNKNCVSAAISAYTNCRGSCEDEFSLVVNIGLPAIPGSIKMLSMSRSHDWPPLGGINLLSKIGLPAVPSLLAALNGEDKSLYMGAAIALGEIYKDSKSKVKFPKGLIDYSKTGASREVIDSLIRKLYNQDFYIRQSAIEALGNIGIEAGAAVEDLNSLLSLKNDRETRLTAVRALARMKELAYLALKNIQKALGDPDAWIRGAAADLIGKIRPVEKSTITALIEAFKKENCEIQKVNIIHALGDMGPYGINSLRFLETTMENTKLLSIKLAVAKAMGKIVGIHKLIELSKSSDPYTRSSAFCAMSVIKEKAAPAVDILTKALSDDDELVRRDAIDALGNIGPKAAPAAAALVDALKDKHGGIRESATNALGNIGPQAARMAAFPLLNIVLWSNHYLERHRAVAALKKIGELELTRLADQMMGKDAFDCLDILWNWNQMQRT